MKLAIFLLVVFVVGLLVAAMKDDGQGHDG